MPEALIDGQLPLDFLGRQMDSSISSLRMGQVFLNCWNSYIVQFQLPTFLRSKHPFPVPIWDLEPKPLGPVLWGKKPVVPCRVSKVFHSIFNFSHYFWQSRISLSSFWTHLYIVYFAMISHAKFLLLLARVGLVYISLACILLKAIPAIFMFSFSCLQHHINHN